MIASMADTIITSNKLIGEDCKNRFNVKYVILDSIVEQQEINSAICEKPCSETIKILFAGNSEHKYAFEKYIAPILKEVSDSSLYKISITCIGVYPNIKPISSKLDVCYMPSMPLEQYRWYVKNQKFDIGIAVIEDNRFSHRKYINKFFEFTIIGAVGVYTNCLPYKDAALEAAKLRFRAVMMTNIAFILGLLPLVFAKGAGAASRNSVGMTVFGGMMAVAFIGTFLVPAYYVIIEGFKAYTHKLAQK